MKTVVLVLVMIVGLAMAQAEKRKDHHDLEGGHQNAEGGHHDHEGKTHKGFKAYYHEKKLKEHRKGYGHDDKRYHKGIKSPNKHALEVPAHEAHLQGDLKSPKGYKERPNHESWHKKDSHLQDLSFINHKSHHVTRNPGRPHLPTKGHHQMLQNDQPAALATHHKEPSSEERGFLHRPRKVTPSAPGVNGDKNHGHHGQKLAKSLTKSFRPEHEIKHQDQERAPKKSPHHQDKTSWLKNKKPKKAYEKKQKQHRKKQFKGELHKLW